jgi:hypothetical protein
MSDTAGSIESVTIEGQTFNVAADANLSRIPTKFEKSKIATSGRAMTKAIKRVTSIEGVVFVLNGADGEALKFFGEAMDDKQVVVTYISGDSYQALCEIDVESHESEENRYTASFHPSEDWTAFLA